VVLLALKVVPGSSSGVGGVRVLGLLGPGAAADELDAVAGSGVERNWRWRGQRVEAQGDWPLSRRKPLWLNRLR
jgi:hypothetical protein